ncbi:UNVERIFIED_CONTAM: hypothetical protein PYX00_005032 [Menopon gallinae]|uniref:Uncharacterized protein n=1 Tax=Menopon gallinae TaxID=328185 RepID=A0AAW2I6C2_9NEOP
MSPLLKPQLRGHLRRDTLKHAVIMGGIVVAAFLSYKYLHLEPKKRACEEHEKNYDAVKHAQELKRYGLLQSTKPKKKDE